MDVNENVSLAGARNPAFKTRQLKKSKAARSNNLPVKGPKKAINGTGGAETSPDRSPYLVNRLFETSNKNLFNHVKFHLVKQAIDELQLSRPRILDIGCGLQVSRQYLEALQLDFQYFGIDYEPRFEPDAVVDLDDLSPLTNSLPWKPDIVLALDVLEHVHEDPQAIKKIVGNIKSVIGENTTLIVTLPQLYRLDRFKLPHLHYPEHKIRLNQSEWREIVESHFDIKKVQGLGYLSVVPYLPMLSKRYKPDNRLGSLFSYLRGTFFEWSPFKPADLFLSNTLGKLKPLKTLSNDILFVATPRK